MNGWGPKSSVCPSKPRESKLFGGISRDFWRDVPGVPAKFEKIKFVFNFWTLQTWLKVHKTNLSKAFCGSYGTPPPTFEGLLFNMLWKF